MFPRLLSVNSLFLYRPARPHQSQQYHHDNAAIVDFEIRRTFLVDTSPPQGPAVELWVDRQHLVASCIHELRGLLSLACLDVQFVGEPGRSVQLELVMS